MSDLPTEDDPERSRAWHADDAASAGSDAPSLRPLPRPTRARSVLPSKPASPRARLSRPRWTGRRPEARLGRPADVALLLLAVVVLGLVVLVLTS